MSWFSVPTIQSFNLSGSSGYCEPSSPLGFGLMFDLPSHMSEVQLLRFPASTARFSLLELVFSSNNPKFLVLLRTGKRPSTLGQIRRRLEIQLHYVAAVVGCRFA